MEAKIDQKSIKKWSRKWNASWHRFLIDFGGFRGPSWGGKSIKNRSKNGYADYRQKSIKSVSGAIFQCRQKSLKKVSKKSEKTLKKVPRKRF